MTGFYAIPAALKSDAARAPHNRAIPNRNRASHREAEV